MWQTSHCTRQKRAVEMQSGCDRGGVTAFRWLIATFFVSSIAACTSGSGDNSAKVDTSGPAPSSAVAVTHINTGSAGMSARVRWLLSRDKMSILAVVDPVGVENEPVPNAFFFGSESANFQTRMDSVWDVAVSPDWKQIAYSRAFVVRGGGSDAASGLSPGAWNEIAGRTGIDTATLRTSSFSASGMSFVSSVAVPGVIQVGGAEGSTIGIPGKLYPIARGWRVRWTSDGKFIGLSANPARAQDDEFPQTWASLDPTTGTLNTALPSNTTLEQPKWSEGPTLDVSVKVDLTHAPQLFAKSGEVNYTIESERGVITMRASDQKNPAVAVGPGIALATTAGGRYILALAPRANPGPGEASVEAVVYSVSR
jgi:hypothetical protein